MTLHDECEMTVSLPLSLSLNRTFQELLYAKLNTLCFKGSSRWLKQDKDYYFFCPLFFALFF